MVVTRGHSKTTFTAMEEGVHEMTWLQKKLGYSGEIFTIKLFMVQYSAFWSYFTLST